jgi:uncharacterized protein (DUF1778 family)
MKFLTRPDRFLKPVRSSANQEIVLSPSEWDSFIATLENPPPPNTVLKAALKDYQDNNYA